MRAAVSVTLKKAAVNSLRNAKFTMQKQAAVSDTRNLHFEF